MMNDIVVVAYDCLTPLGPDLSSTWSQLTANASGIRSITRYDPAAESLHGVSSIAYAGQVPFSYCELAGSPNKYKRSPEPVFHCIGELCKRTLRSINFDIKEHDCQRIALIGGTALTSQVSHYELVKTGRPFANFLLNQCQNVPLAIAGEETGIRGPCFSVNSACASSGQALYLACQFIRTNVVDCALVVGHEFPIAPACVAGFEWLNALYKRDRPADRAYDRPEAASRPFSIDRRGFVLAEGAGAVFITRADYAKTMSWPCRGTILGGYLNSDAHHLTRISVENVAHCISAALRSAGCSLSDIGCVSAHATSTPTGDEAELDALAQVFGKSLVTTPIMANKSQVGHALGASSILQFIFALNSLEFGLVLPTLNYLRPETSPEAWIPTECLSYAHRRILLNSFGFGGTNVSLVVGNN